MTRQDVEDYLLGYENTWRDFPFGEDISVYSVGDVESKEGKMFAVVQDATKPLRVSLRCDSQLAVLLREKYETVLPGENLDKKTWNTIICTGQLSDEEIKDFVRLSYQIAREA